jgi:hypothetical protein
VDPVQVPLGIATVQAGGNRRLAPMQRNISLVLPANSVMVPQFKRASASKTTIASIVMSCGLSGREKLRLADQKGTNFVPHGGHSGRIGDHVAFDLVAADTALPGTGAA